MNAEWKKYLFRFGLVLLITVPILVLTLSLKTLQLIGYKLCLIAIGTGFAELIWSVFFKPQFGKSEKLPANEKQSVLMFRAVLYGAIILALCLGL